MESLLTFYEGKILNSITNSSYPRHIIHCFINYYRYGNIFVKLKKKRKQKQKQKKEEEELKYIYYQ